MRKRLIPIAFVPFSIFALVFLRAGFTPPPPTVAKPAVSADPTPEQLDARFHSTVQPFVQEYCVECHSGPRPKAGLDLSSYTNFAGVNKDLRRWNVVLAKVKSGDMPPDDADKIPTAAQRQPFLDWIQTIGTIDSKRHAGDPGLVLARRLSNAEYDYTIRDLTGVDMQPTKEFPVDPANQAGFDNSGESLAMSPAMVKKYMDAARLVADHIVFEPQGFRFAPFPVVTDEDRDNYAVHRIVDFYKQQPTDFADYFLAAWRFQNRAALGKPKATLADFAADAKISPKYLDIIWATVSAKSEDSGPIAAVQARWHSLPAPVNGQEPDNVRVACGWIRDLILGLRPLVQPQFDNLVSNDRIIAAGSQTLVLWKDNQYAANRMNYAGNAQKLDMSGYAQTDPALIIPTTVDAQARYEDSFKRFCVVFPDAFYISERARMFLTNPKDIASDLAGHRLLTAGFHSQMGYFRDDVPLCDLVLNDSQKHQLDVLWDELNFSAEVPYRQYKQFLWFERAEPPSFMTNPVFNSYRPEDEDITSEARIKQLGATFLAEVKKANLNPNAEKAVQDYFLEINDNIRALEKEKVAAEPGQLQSLVDFAQRAYRRPMSNAEKTDLLAFYHSLRAQNLTHEDAIRDSVVSVLMSPYFFYVVDLPSSGKNSAQAAQPLTDYQLASRLSYFLWSSMPDQELLNHAAAGDLHQPAVLVAQAKRMLQDDRVRDFATEFACNWLDIRRFEETNSVDRDHFPQFTNDLREAMFQEPIHFFSDLVHRNGSVLDLVYGNYTFVNPVLAKHYGMPDPKVSADTWVRVDDAGKYERGGLLPMSVFLTKNAPGLRTSPVKRGNWFVTRILGEVIPAPPPNVPALPTDETKLGDLTLRQALAKHREDPTCASCHAKFDSFGLVFEGFGPIGEARTLDLAGRPVDTTAVFPDGSNGSGLDGLRSYLHTKTQDEFLDNLARKLLVYALGRSLLPSDETVVTSIHQKLASDGYRFDDLIDGIVTSPQFLTKRTNSQLAQE